MKTAIQKFKNIPEETKVKIDHDMQKKGRKKERNRKEQQDRFCRDYKRIGLIMFW